MTEPKKQGTRMIKVSCACGYNLRMTAKWISVGIPKCPTHPRTPMTVEGVEQAT